MQMATKRVGVTILASNKIDFKLKTATRDNRRSLCNVKKGPFPRAVEQL